MVKVKQEDTTEIKHTIHVFDRDTVICVVSINKKMRKTEKKKRTY